MRSLDIRVRKKPMRAADIPEPARPRAAAKAVKRPFSRRWLLWLPAGILVLAALWLAAILLPRAVLTVTPRTEAVTRDLEIRVDKNQSEPDMAALAVPGQIVSEQASGSRKVQSTGSKNIGSKSSGFVRIYNFSKNTLILKKETTVLSANGRQYSFAQDASGIRPTALIGFPEQEVDPSSLTPPIPVVADGAGESYNLAAGARLELHNEAFGSNPKALYGLVEGDGIIGGTTKSAKVVIEADITAGHSALATELLEAARQKLAGGPASARLLPEALKTESLEQAATATAGEERPEFEVSQKLRLTALAFAENDVRGIMIARTSRLLPPDKVLRTDSQARLSAKFLAVDLAAGTGVLSAHFESTLVYHIDADLLSAKARGKTADEIRELFLSRPEIADVEVRLSPFWAKKAPKYSKKIRVDTR